MTSVRIVTRYRNTFGAGRILASATVNGRRVQRMIPYDHALTMTERHRLAALTLADAIGADNVTELSGDAVVAGLAWTAELAE